MREDVFRGVFKNSISGKELRKYDDYAQYPRSALILRVLSKKRWPSTASGKVVSCVTQLKLYNLDKLSCSIYC